jgi:glutamate-1-semialdehyde 2,1-aminomutase
MTAKMTTRRNTKPKFDPENILTPLYDFISMPRLEGLIAEETELFKKRNPKSAELQARAANSMYRSVVSTWHLDGPETGGFPHLLYMSRGKDNRMWDADGNEYVDYVVGDCPTIFGHGPDSPVTRGVADHILNDASCTFFPAENSIKVAEMLQERYGLKYWHLAMSASDANRFAISIARSITGRPKMACFNMTYHGTIEDFLKSKGLDGAEDTSWITDVRPGKEASDDTAIAIWNDLESVEEVLKNEDVAILVTEPFNTNLGGFWLPEPGFHDGLRELCDKYGTYLLIDETHTQISSVTGCLHMWDLKPDFYTLGKCIAGGAVPCGVYGYSEEIGEKMGAAMLDDPQTWAGKTGLGTTMSGSPLQLKALELSLTHNYTEENFDKMSNAIQYIADGVNHIFDKYDVPFRESHLGARIMLQFTPDECESTVEQVQSQAYGGYHEYFNLYMYNRGVATMPAGNLLLAAPQTSKEDCDLFLKLLDECVANMLG